MAPTKTFFPIPGTRDGFGNQITSTVDALKRGLDVNIVGGSIVVESALLEVNLDAADDDVQITDPASGNSLAITAGGAAKVDGSATTQPISAASLPLPAGAATSANQTALLENLVDFEDSIPFSAFGEIVTADLTPKAGWRFDYGVNTRLVTSTVANGGAITADASRAKLSTSAASNGSAQLLSKKSLRYMPGMGGLARFTAAFAPGTASSQQLIGIGDANDGFFFGYDGTSFGIMRRRAASDTWTAQGSWNGSTLGETLDPTLGNVYQIRLQGVGYGSVSFYVFDKTVSQYVHVHTIAWPNTSALTSILNPTLPLQAEIKNTGNTSDLIMYTPFAMAAVEGTVVGLHRDPMAVFNSWDAVQTIADTTNDHHTSIQNKTTINGITNRVPVQIDSINIGTDNNAAGVVRTIRLYKDATTTGARSYSDISTANSPVSVSNTVTTISGGTSERTYFLLQSQNTILEFMPGELTLSPGEVLTLSVQDSGGTSLQIVATFNWSELF